MPEKHIALPVTIDSDRSEIKGDDGKVLAIAPNPQVAERITHCVNNFEKLVSACRMAKEELVFGGDWETAKKVIENALEDAQQK